MKNSKVLTIVLVAVFTVFLWTLPGTDRASAAACPTCDDGNSCTTDVCNSDNTCSNINSCGGIIPCGRHGNDPVTPWDDSAPCTFCHLVLLMQLLIEFLLKLAAVVSILVIVYAGLRYMLAAGDTSGMQTAKTALRYALTGFAVVFISWALVSTILTMLGYIDPITGTWYAVDCGIA